MEFIVAMAKHDTYILLNIFGTQGSDIVGKKKLHPFSSPNMLPTTGSMEPHICSIAMSCNTGSISLVQEFSSCCLTTQKPLPSRDTQDRQTNPKRGTISK